MISRIEKIDQEDRTKGRIVAGSGKPVAEEGKCIFEEKLEPEISYNLATIPGAVVSYAPDGVVDSRFFIVGSRKVYQEELDEIRENNYPKQMVDLHQSVFAQVVEGMDVIDRIIRENPSTPEEEITDIEIVSVNIEKYQESAQEQSEEGMELQTSADNQEAKPVLSYQSSGN